MTVTKKIPTDQLRGLDFQVGDIVRVVEVSDESILLEIQRAESTPPREVGPASDWLRTAPGSVRLAPNKSADDARMAYYVQKYRLET